MRTVTKERALVADGGRRYAYGVLNESTRLEENLGGIRSKSIEYSKELRESKSCSLNRNVRADVGMHGNFEAHVGTHLPRGVPLRDTS